MVISNDFIFLENDQILLDLDKDTLELKCSLDIDGNVSSGSNEIINASSPDDFNYYYTLLIQAGERKKFIQKVFVELTKATTRVTGVYSFNIKDFKKNLYDFLLEIFNGNKLTTDSKILLDSFNSLDTINVTLSVFYIDKNLDLPSLVFSNTESFSEIPSESVKREKFSIPSMNNKENVFYVSETNNFPYKYEISWDKIKLFKEFLVTIYCGQEKLLTFKTTDTKLDLFNFNVVDKTYNLKDLLGDRTDVSGLRIEIKMVDSIIPDDGVYNFYYTDSDSPINIITYNTAAAKLDPPKVVAGSEMVRESKVVLQKPGFEEAFAIRPVATSLIATYENSLYLKYRIFLPNQTYTFGFDIDWSKYTNNKITHIHNKVSRSNSKLVFDITAQEYPFKILYLFGNVDIIVILRDILAFIFTFPWDVLKDVGVTIKDILCCLNIDLNLNMGNTCNKMMDIMPGLSKNLATLYPLISSGKIPSNRVANDGFYRSQNEEDCSGWKDILHDCIDSCKKSSTSDCNSKSCSHSSETNTSCKERNCNLRNTLILLQEKIIQFNNLLPRVMVGTYVFNNKDDRLGFDHLNNGTPYGLVTLSYSFLLNSISGSNNISNRIDDFKKDKKELLNLEMVNIDNKIFNYKTILETINNLININNNAYKTNYQVYINSINMGETSTQISAKKLILDTSKTKNTLLENELEIINRDISVLQKEKLDISLKINDINKNSTIDLVNYDSVSIQFSIDSPSANPDSYIIKFIDEKNVDTLTFDTNKHDTEADHEDCKPHSGNKLLHTFVNKF